VVASIATGAITAAALAADASAEIVTALLAKTGWTAGGTTSLGTLAKYLLAMAAGKFVIDGDSYKLYDDDNSTLLLTIPLTATGRTVTKA